MPILWCWRSSIVLPSAARMAIPRASSWPDGSTRCTIRDLREMAMCVGASKAGAPDRARLADRLPSPTLKSV